MACNRYTGSATPAEESNDTLTEELERWANHTSLLLQRMARESLG